MMVYAQAWNIYENMMHPLESMYLATAYLPKFWADMAVSVGTEFLQNQHMTNDDSKYERTSVFVLLAN